MKEILYENITQKKREHSLPMYNRVNATPQAYLKEKFGDNFCIYPEVTLNEKRIVVALEIYYPGAYLREIKIIDIASISAVSTMIELMAKDMLTEATRESKQLETDIKKIEANNKNIVAEVKPTNTNNPGINNNVTNFNTDFFEDKTQTSESSNRVTDEQLSFLRKFKQEKCNGTDEILDLYIQAWSKISKYKAACKIDLLKSGEFIIGIFIEWAKTCSDFFEIGSEK